MATFRPSVLPDRDNDILSSFTRAFESARQRVRQDQQDRQAAQLFDQRILDLQEARETRNLQAQITLATSPGIRVGQTAPSQQARSINEIVRGLPRPMFQQEQDTLPGTARTLPREVPGTRPPPDIRGVGALPGERGAVDVGTIGGQPVTFSDVAARTEGQARRRREAEFLESLPEGVERQRQRDLIDRNAQTLADAGLVTNPDTGEIIELGGQTGIEFGLEAFRQRGRERVADITAEGARERASVIDRENPRLRSLLAAVTSELRREEDILLQEEGLLPGLERDLEGGPLPRADRARIYERVVRERHAAGVFTDEERDTLLRNNDALLDEIEAQSRRETAPGGPREGDVGATGGELAPERLSLAAETLLAWPADQREGVMREMGFTDVQIQQVLTAIAGGS